MAVQFRGPISRRFDWEHIFERHSDQGAVAQQSTAETVFAGLTNEQIQARVRSAWRRRSLVLSQWSVSGEVIEFWYNVRTKIVETAYPMRFSE